MRTGLLLLYKNSRVENNQAIVELNKLVDRVVIAIIQDTENPFSVRFSQTHQSALVKNVCNDIHTSFLMSLRTKGYEVASCSIDDVRFIQSLIKTNHVEIIASAFHPSLHFQSLCLRICAKNPDLDYIEFTGNTLFELKQLPFTLQELPASFSHFRKVVEPLSKALFEQSSQYELDDYELRECTESQADNYSELHAFRHLKYYFSSSYPHYYKQTRNQLHGTHFSTGFSPYLAHGTLWVKQIVGELAKYECLYGRNDSTEWVYFELLWREYFYWYAKAHGKKLFTKAGLKSSPPLTSFYAHLFRGWCEGMTTSPLVNAIMRELNATGWISNRARQIAASYLVNELQIDWRHGAAYFEQTLIDYDVAINWGNWQYIAGVGADPRGGRHFNIEKQTQMYDAEGTYRAIWLDDPNEAYENNTVEWM
jgi:deoxyribodipyrimidine photo-lyase